MGIDSSSKYRDLCFSIWWVSIFSCIQHILGIELYSLYPDYALINKAQTRGTKTLNPLVSIYRYGNHNCYNPGQSKAELLTWSSITIGKLPPPPYVPQLFRAIQYIIATIQG